MTGTQIRHLDPNGRLKRDALVERFTCIQDNDMYRGNGGAAVAFSPVAGTVMLMGTAGAGLATFGVLGKHSILITNTNCSSNASPCVITWRIVGYDLQGVLQTEDILISTTNASSEFKQTVFIYSYVLSVTYVGFTGSTPQATPLMAIGHGAGSSATQQFRNRLPISHKCKSVGSIRVALDPLGQPIALNNGVFGIVVGNSYSYDFVRHTLVTPTGTTMVAGEYVIIYNPDYAGEL